MTQFTCKGVKQINNRISLNMTFTFTIRISRRFSSAQEFQMGNFQKLIAKCRSRFYCTWFFSWAEDFESWRGGMEGTLKIGRKMVPPEDSHVWSLFKHSFNKYLHFLYFVKKYFLITEFDTNPYYTYNS